MTAFHSARRRRHGRCSVARDLLLLFLLTATSAVHLAAQEKEDLDAHTLRFDGFWFNSQPSGSFHGNGTQGRFDLQRDVNFNSYNTAAIRVEWRFTRKNHLFVGFLPINQTKQAVLSRTVFFQGQTFGAGLFAKGQLVSDVINVGYQYDIIRRRRGHLGIVAQLDLFYIRGSLSAAAHTLNGTTFVGQRASSTLRAPLPIFGPDFRYYLTNSGRLFVNANLLGMYFFGYGNFISSIGTVGISLNKHLNLQGGYQLGSRFDIKSKTDRIGLNLTQRGAVAGLEVSF
jgi:hypothetical protein